MAIKVQIPGLTRCLVEADMEQSHHLYNSLPLDEDQPNEAQTKAQILKCLPQLAEIFVRNDVHHSFGVHSLHRHSDLPEKTVMFRSQPDPDCHLTEPTEVASLKLTRLYGHKFVLTEENNFHPYEYVYPTGEQIDMIQASDGFFIQLADCIRRNGLNRVIALEVLDNPSTIPMVEVVVGDATVMLERGRLNCRSQRTGWVFTTQDGKPCVRPDGDGHYTNPITGKHSIAKPPKKDTHFKTWWCGVLCTLRELSIRN